MRFIAFSTHILAHRNHDDGTASSYFGGQNRAFRSQLELILGGAARARLVVVLLRSWPGSCPRLGRNDNATVNAPGNDLFMNGVMASDLYLRTTARSYEAWPSQRPSGGVSSASVAQAI